jgi:hypothetical protein
LTGENTADILLLMYHEVLSRGEIMKDIVKGAIRNEKGQALILALILLAVGGLILAPLLAYMRTGLTAGEVCEVKTNELYAADAGVEDAVWKIQNQIDIPTGCYLDTTRSYNITDVNGKKVAYNITRANNVTLTYHVVSTATGDGSGTKIDAYITGTSVYDDYHGILDNVITSRCDYRLGGPAQVDPPEDEEHGPVANYQEDWPTAEVFRDVYWEDVKNEVPYNSGTLDVKDYTTSGIGPLYRNGTLDIYNSGTKDLTVTLNGTVYVTGDTTIGTKSGGKNFYLNLNKQTIFVESGTGAAPEDDPCNPAENQYALRIGSGCTLTGSGCIIVVGNIEFKPNLSCSPSDYIFVLSVGGETYMQPNGKFYGTLAGNSEVYMQNGEAQWVDPSGIQLNFPYTVEIGQVYSIASWEISPL